MTIQTNLITRTDQLRELVGDESLQQFFSALKQSKLPSFEPLAPFFLDINGKPYHLQKHFPFAPLFRFQMATSTLLKSGRQCGKSSTLAARGVMLCQLLPFFKQLYITPLFEMVRRFSSNYVAPFINSTILKDLVADPKVVNSVLQRSFANGSSMTFSFAYLDATRARGIPADEIDYDEIQDMNISFLPIIIETISASQNYGLILYAGTPKSMDNTMEKLWSDSSMAEYIIKCATGGCNHYNIPSIEYDLLDMMGPYHPDISEKNPAIVCAKCRKPLNPLPQSRGGGGRWVHRYEKKRWEFAGLHIPQQIMPIHYARPRQWQRLLNKSQGKGNFPLNTFYNEVCGESWDAGSKLISLTDLRKAAKLPWKNNREEAIPNSGGYLVKILGVDWGGGGVSRGKSDLALQSYTTLAVCGLRPEGAIDVIYGYRSYTPLDHVREAREVLKVASDFGCHFVAHDFVGAGTARETILVQAGMPIDKLLPVAYCGGLKGGLLNYKPATELMPRSHYVLDRNRSLSYCCQFIKSGVIRFFADDYQNNEEPGVLRDFLSLIEDKSDSFNGRGSYKILRDPAGPDDFAHSVNLASMMCYNVQNAWPDLSAYEDVPIDADYLMSLQTLTEADWLQ